ncbi:MAG: hypothetical protein HY897_25305 [Deltaproteobacteria bacterium]|nr:hypothetical protein [Deltaproteobacteria bacterium]
MAVQTRTTTQLKTLTSMEEKVYRMRRGAVLDPDDELESKAADNPRLAAQIADVERGIFAKLSTIARPGRADPPVKTKIIASLKARK